MQLIHVFSLLLSCASSPPAVEEAPTPAPQPAAPAAPALAGRLLWVSQPSHHEIRTVQAAPSGENPEQAMPLVWGEGAAELDVEGAIFPGPVDPRGELDLFIRTVENPGHGEQMFTVKDGSTPKAIGSGAPAIRNPSWAPSGDFLVYESSEASFRDLYSVGRNGAPIKRLTDAKHGSFEPDVGGRQQQVVFVSSRDGDAEIYVMGADGASQTRLTERAGDDMKPKWSPKGQITWLAREALSVRLHIMDADGSNARPFRQKPLDLAVVLDQAWSPDGSRLAATVQTGPTDVAIHILDADGALVAEVDGPGADEHPAWSPDSAWLVFDAQRDGQAEPDLYRVDRDGKQLTRLTDSPAADWLPRWRK